MIDIITCYVKLNNNIDLDKKSGFGLLFLTVRITADTTITQPQQLNLYLKNTKNLIDIYLKIRESYTERFPQTELFIPNLLNDCKVIKSNYLIALHRFTSIAAKDQKYITKEEQKWLAKLLKMNDETVNEKEKINISPELKSNSNNELNQLIGMKSVKTEIVKLTNFIKIQQKRQEKGLKTPKVSYHCVFTGNPGTGKTTVARIIAKIYKELGIIKTGRLIETDRAGLVAEYVGQTAVKTNKIIDMAIDGVLFIDEAYALISNSETDYGKEAIATLIKRMEDSRESMVVILAGYSNEMQNFINSNPGLQSRFNRYIEFPDYSDQELYRIFEMNAIQFEYTISKNAQTALKKYLTKTVAEKNKNFGNARFVRNLFEKTLEYQANRLVEETNLTAEKLSEIKQEDIKYEN
ncbi:MAG: AAA family ATPase [Dysgonamonadaceae bacterium]|jgi:SpoVK/Ycf46/Vps4 family AAA+-type ATPase|nr:AAA family ATPase [Dysgonamonadaceae bacterium]